MHLKVHTIITILVVILIFIYAFSFKVQPFSDFKKNFWDVSTNPSIYIKGTIIPFLYTPFNIFNIPPFLAASIVNSLFFIIISFSLYFINKNLLVTFLSTFLLILIGIWFIGMGSIVNSDLPHIALIIGSLRLLISNINRKYTIFAILLLSIGLSIRNQSFLAFSFLLPFFVFINYRYKLHLHYYIIGIFVLTTILSFSFSLLNKDKIALKLNYRIPLFTGFLYASTDINCGSWTKKTYDQTDADINKSLFSIFQKQLTFSNTISLLKCKTIRYLSFNQFSYDWLYSSILSTYTSPANFPVSIIVKGSKFEILFTNLSKILIIILIVWNIIKNNKIFYIPLLLVISYYVISLIFEIQARYIMEPIAFCLYVILIILNYQKKIS